MLETPKPLEGLEPLPRGTAGTTSPVDSASEEAVALLVRDLLERWRRDTLVLSGAWQLYEHPAYRQIVALGELALPQLFRELRARPGAWVQSLQDIQGFVPVGETDRPTFGELVEAWLRWGAGHGY